MFEANLSYTALSQPELQSETLPQKYKTKQTKKELSLNEMSSPASIHYENMSTDF